MQFIIKEDPEKQHMFTFDELEPVSFWYFCLKTYKMLVISFVSFD